MDDKLKRIADLKTKRKAMDDEIKSLTAEAESELKAALNGDRKPRKPRAAKQPALPLGAK